MRKPQPNCNVKPKPLPFQRQRIDHCNKFPGIDNTQIIIIFVLKNDIDINIKTAISNNGCLDLKKKNNEKFVPKLKRDLW